ncbi:CAP domain-containing protein [Pradoshia sp.]
MKKVLPVFLSIILFLSALTAIHIPDAEAASKTLYVTSSTGLKSSAKSSSSTLLTLSTGRSLSIDTATLKNGYYKTKTSGKTGWVLKSKVSEYAHSLSKQKIYKTTSTKSKVLKTLNAKVNVTIVGKSGQRYKVKSGSTVGWVVSSNFKIGKYNPTFEEQVITLVNQKRKAAGLKALKSSSSLNNVAEKKSKDMRDKKYFSHTSPTFGNLSSMLKKFDISYKAAGENIAAGQTTPASVVNSWMNSPGHKANILSKKYTHIGVGYVSGGNYRHYWTQIFIAQ